MTSVPVSLLGSMFFLGGVGKRGGAVEGCGEMGGVMEEDAVKSEGV